MFEVEAARLCDILLGQSEISPLLNLGSSTAQFRQFLKPHIDAKLFKPLERAGVEVIHCDLKEGEGVDLSGDILDPAVRTKLAELGFKSILLSNLLEHVRDRAAVIAACEEIVGSGGIILATVPSSFPYHADPIDTLYRPSPAALAGAFTRSRLIIAEELAGPSFREHLRQREIGVWRELVSTILWSLIFFARPRSAASRLDRWRWFCRPYRVSIALLSVR